MGTIAVDWDSEDQRIVVWTFARGWTWDDFRAASTESIALLNTVTHDAAVIFDINHTSLPQGNAIHSLRSMQSVVQENVCKRIIVNADGFTTAIVRIVGQIYKLTGNTPLVFANSLDEARAMAQTDPCHFDS